MQNIWTLKLDIKKPYGNLIPKYTTGDTNKLIVKIYNDGIAVDLDEENITSGILNMKKADGTIISLMNTVIPYDDRVEITFGNETDSLGEVICKLMLYDDNMVERISTSEFKLIFDEDWVATYPENPSVDLATQMLQAFAALEQRIDDIEAGAGNAHSHDNYATLSKIRYTGDAEEIDLADIESKADVDHNHDDLYQPVGDYAPANHNHDDKYADIEHNHNGVYQPIGDYAPTNHDHDTEYAPIEHEHDMEDVTGLDTALSGKADVTHNHDNDYAAKTHNHDGTYAPANHNHNDVYAPIEHDHAISDVDGLQTALNGKSNTNHTHAGTYAPVVHNHDGVYSPVDHNHDEVYSPVDHNHDSDYAEIEHNHDMTDVTGLSAALAGKADVEHNHDEEYAPVDHNHDDTYSEIGHQHTEADITDLNKYTKEEIDDMFVGVFKGDTFRGSKSLGTTQANTNNVTGMYYSTDTANHPVNEVGYLFHIQSPSSNNLALQFFVPNVLDRVFFRRRVTAGWQPWIELSDTGHSHDEFGDISATLAKMYTKEEIDDMFVGVFKGDNVRGSQLLEAGEANSILSSGFYYSIDTANNPIADNGYILHIQGSATDNYAQQVFFHAFSNRMWIRRKQAGTWEAWVEIGTGSGITEIEKSANGVTTAMKVEGITIKQEGNKTWRIGKKSYKTGSEGEFTRPAIKTNPTTQTNDGTFLKYSTVITPQYIVIHDTANYSPTASARGHAEGIRDGWLTAYAHFYVDDVDVYQITPENNRASHTSGGGIAPANNSNSIGIEICVNKFDLTYKTSPLTNTGYKKAVENAIAVVTYLMKKYNIPIENVYRHKDTDAEAKNCPSSFRFAGNYMWDWFRKTLRENFAGSHLAFARSTDYLFPASGRYADTMSTNVAEITYDNKMYISGRKVLTENDEVDGKITVKGGVHKHSEVVASNMGTTDKWFRVARVRLAENYGRVHFRMSMYHSGTYSRFGQIVGFLYKQTTNTLNSNCYVNFINDTGTDRVMESGNIKYVVSKNAGQVDAQGRQIQDPVIYVDIYVKLREYAKLYINLDFLAKENGGYFEFLPDGSTTVDTLPTAGQTYWYDDLTTTYEEPVDALIKTVSYV